MKFISLLMASVIVLAGCASVPEPISIAENESLTAFEAVASNKETPVAKGTKARWGGKIVAVENKKDVSEIEIVYFPSNHYGKPRTGQESLGRFKAVVEGFVDPLVFEQGRLVTIVGEIGDIQTDLIGEQEYQYPTLAAVGYHMWKEVEEVRVDTVGFSPFFYSGFRRAHYFGRSSLWGLHSPFFENHHRRVRITRNNGHDQGATVSRTPSSGARDTNSKESAKRTQAID